MNFIFYREDYLICILYFFHRKEFRILIPGAGTDGGTFHLAEELNHTNAEILYMDFSSVSKQIAQTRATIRKLSNIVWLNDWLESLTFLGVNRFELVICS